MRRMGIEALYRKPTTSKKLTDILPDHTQHALIVNIR
jgi:hypothetical protein